MSEINVTIGPEIVLSYPRLKYSIFHALAEFIDNSTAAFQSNIDLFNAIGQKQVEINITSRDGNILIEDNSIGMDKPDLEKALTIGREPSFVSGRSIYGLGMKTAAFWFADTWQIETKKLNQPFSYKVSLDIHRVAKGNFKLELQEIAHDPKEHFTKITLFAPRKKILNSTKNSLIEKLGMMYREDFITNKLRLYIDSKAVAWDEDVLNHQILQISGSLQKLDIEFSVDKKKIKGFAAVLEKGGRKKAGFCLLKSGRMVRGWDLNPYKPADIFGDQEGGSNDLVNQRLFGILDFSDFEVTHTKDDFNIRDIEWEEISFKLKSAVEKLIEVAKTHRKSTKTVPRISDIDTIQSLLRTELSKPELIDFVTDYETTTTEYLEQLNSSIITLQDEKDALINVKIGNVLKTVIYFNADFSERDFYYYLRLTINPDDIVIVVNTKHPYFLNLKDDFDRTEYVKQLVFDAVAEWKARKRHSSITSVTIRAYKDELLRLDFSQEPYV